MCKSCIVCKAGASPDLQLQYCARCQSASYCSKACQRKDWKKQHKKICTLLNVGRGGMQLRMEDHIRQFMQMEELFESNELRLDKEGNVKQFFKLFRESTLEGSRAAALEMQKIAKRQTNVIQKCLLLHSLHLLIRCSNSEMLSWPNSPLLVLLKFVDANAHFGDGVTGETLLHHLADLGNPSDYTTQVNQLILAQQLIEHGANVNAVSVPKGETPLHSACSAGVVTNLDFVELLLVEGANPNAQSQDGKTPLMITATDAPGAAKLLLKWPTTDFNIALQSGESFLVMVRWILSYLSKQFQIAPVRDDAQHFLFQQWLDIEEMLMEKGAR
jgi:hypothetical protein